MAEENNSTCASQKGPLDSLPSEAETIGSCEAIGRKSENNSGPSISDALLHEEIETLRRQVEGWKDLYKSTQALIKDKDAKIAQLLLAGTGTANAITTEDRNVSPPAPPAVKPPSEQKTPAAEVNGNKPKPRGRKPKNQQQPNDVRIQHLMKRLRKHVNIRKDEFTEVHVFSMTVDGIWLAAQDENFIVQPSYDEKLMPELIKLMPPFVREKFDKLDNDLPKKSLEEFSVWLNDVVDVAIDRIEWETDDELYYSDGFLNSNGLYDFEQLYISDQLFYKR